MCIEGECSERSDAPPAARREVTAVLRVPLAGRPLRHRGQRLVGQVQLVGPGR